MSCWLWLKLAVSAPPVKVLAPNRSVFHWPEKPNCWLAMNSSLERAAGDDIDRAGQRLPGDQAGAGAARDVDALDAAEGDAVQAIGGGYRREDGGMPSMSSVAAAGQVVEHDVADVADRAFGLNGDARAACRGPRSASWRRSFSSSRAPMDSVATISSRSLGVPALAPDC